MKKLILLPFLILFANLLFAQIQNPVAWTATSKKIADKTYEVRLTANMQKGWHIYSQKHSFAHRYSLFQ